MGETAPNLTVEEREERMAVVVRFLTTFGNEGILGRTVINTEPPESVEDYVVRNDHCYNGVKGTMDQIDNYPPESEIHRNAIEDGKISISVYEQLLNPA